MKRGLGWEVVWLLLPVLFIGGVAGLKKTGRLNAWNPLDTGPKRWEISSCQRVQVTPLDVSHGIKWKVQGTWQLKGRCELPSSLKENAVSYFFSDEHVVYRLGKTWKRSAGLQSWVSPIPGSGTAILTVGLKNVPRDASEMRLRGKMSWSQFFQGTLPPGWVPPANLKKVGTGYLFIADSKPFDEVIEAANQSPSTPPFSREPQIQLVSSQWITGNSTKPNVRHEVFNLTLRHLKLRNWFSQGDLVVEDVRFFDADGRQLQLYNYNGRGRLKDFSGKDGTCFQAWGDSPGPNERKFSLPMLDEDLAPRLGWTHYKQPIRIDLKVSDGICWPSLIRAYCRHEKSE